MNKAQLFDFNGQQVRTVNINDEPYFVGRDITNILEYTNGPKAIRDHVNNEDKTVNESFTVNGTSPILINESGLYSLILSSKLPTAKEFKHWVTSEVLPSIRKTGSYSVQPRLSPEEIELRNRELSYKEQWLKEMEKQNSNKRAELLIKIAEHTHGKLYQELMNAATDQLVFPIYQDKSFTASDIANQIGVDPYTIGTWGQRLGLKAPKGMANRYGYWKDNRYYYNELAVQSFYEHQAAIIDDEF